MIRIVVDITIVLSIVLSIVYLLSFTKQSKAYQCLTAYLILICIIQVLSFYLVRIKSENNLFLSHYYYISQFATLSLFYYYLMKQKWILWVMGVVFVYLGYQYINDPELYDKYNALGIALTQTVLVLIALWYLYQSLSKKNEFILVNIGMFIYLLSSVIIFAFGNLVFEIEVPRYVSRFLNDLNAVLYLLLQGLFFVEWFRNYRPNSKKLAG
ncbi:MAG: hypothetical protein AAF466_03095 [Bacteroidota bacterium]